MIVRSVQHRGTRARELVKHNPERPIYSTTFALPMLSSHKLLSFACVSRNALKYFGVLTWSGSSLIQIWPSSLPSVTRSEEKPCVE